MGNQISKKPIIKANRNSTIQDSSYSKQSAAAAAITNNNTNINGKQQSPQNSGSNGQTDKKGTARTSEDIHRSSWLPTAQLAQATTTTTTAAVAGATTQGGTTHNHGNNNNASKMAIAKQIQTLNNETALQSSVHQQQQQCDQQSRNGAAGLTASKTDQHNPHTNSRPVSTPGVGSGQNPLPKSGSGNAKGNDSGREGGSNGQGSQQQHQQQDQSRHSMEAIAQGTNGSHPNAPSSSNGQTQSNGTQNDTQQTRQSSPQQNSQQQQQQEKPSTAQPSYPAPSIPFAVTSPGNPILVRKHNLPPLVITPHSLQPKGTPPPLSSPLSAAQKKSSELSPSARLPFIGADKSGKSMDIDEMISRLLDAGYSGKIAKSVCLKNSEILAICQAARDVFLSQPTLIELNAPVKIVGDIHGQYTDLLRLFEMCGFPPSANFLFLGDYVDRGRMSLETILLLFSYKIKYPENFFLLRGNHECANVTKVYGFYDECKRRANIKMWKAFVDVFNCLPIAATVANKIFCVHGGLSPSLSTMADIRAIRRPTDVPDYGLLNDLLWSDPSETALDWEDNERGVSYCFGGSIIQKFLNKHDFDLVCRAHMVVEDGYEFFNDRTLVTVFSAPNYCGEFDNFGAVMSVNEDLLCSFELLKPIDQATARAQMQSLAASSGGWRVNKQRLSP
ncbi:hypothetical protein FBU30_009104 [Linnemannia zychae]|nr:hypothetical protein FBU30_009104 [Linnemannia zychae]